MSVETFVNSRLSASEPSPVEADGMIKLAILAVGGQGGGVLTNWVLDVAEANGYTAQSTSVPGVAQRTGATIYYIESLPRDSVPDGSEPVFSLMPGPGDVDVVLSSELVEAGRMLQRGFVSRTPSPRIQ